MKADPKIDVTVNVKKKLNKPWIADIILFGTATGFFAGGMLNEYVWAFISITILAFITIGKVQKMKFGHGGVEVHGVHNGNGKTKEGDPPKYP